jgi:signal transduction histidine kinase
MIRSLTVLAVAAALAAGIMAPAHGAEPAAVTAALVAGLGAASLAIAHAGRRRLGSLRRQFAFAAAVAVGVVLLAVLAAAVMMFVSDHDALLVTAIVAGAAVVALRAASLVAGGVAGDVAALRDALAAVAEGERDISPGIGGADEVGELARAARAMARRLAEVEHSREAADSARRRLVAAVSHDLRTPVTALRLLAEAIDDDLVDDATRRRFLATMQAHLRSLSSMIDDLFELSRIEAGDIEWSMTRVELTGLVHETVAAMAPEARAKGVMVSGEIASPSLAARGDPEKIQRVLFNLIRNAVRHTPADGSVVVRAEPAGAAVELEVADTGHGIAAEDRERIFDAFFRGGPGAARDTDGAGLGLAISRAIVETHGGRIWVAGADRGTSIRFSLPAG